VRAGRDRIRVEMLEGGAWSPSEMAHDVRAGLLATPKDFSPWPKYLYDAEGSRLFEEITGLSEYYQTRTEASILRQRAGQIVSRARWRELVELGSGLASKTRTLLDAMFVEARASGDEALLRYVPLDVSESALRESGERLIVEYPDLEVHGFVGDFERSLGPLLDTRTREDGRDLSGGRLVVFLGGTIGNFTPQRRRSFLAEVRAGLRPEDHLLLGVDLVKDARTLEAAYDDGAGVTARFNKNLLEVINKRLGAEFDSDLFEHRAVYRAEEARIEMWLRSKVEQQIRVKGAGLHVRFEAGECMLTEISAKFTPESVRQMFAEADLQLLELYTDERRLFGLALGTGA
jgi:L-histidine Nalpha-methyltransferase